MSAPGHPAGSSDRSHPPRLSKRGGAGSPPGSAGLRTTQAAASTRTVAEPARSCRPRALVRGRDDSTAAADARPGRSLDSRPPPPFGYPGRAAIRPAPRPTRGAARCRSMTTTASSAARSRPTPPHRGRHAGRVSGVRGPVRPPVVGTRRRLERPAHQLQRPQGQDDPAAAPVRLDRLPRAEEGRRDRARRVELAPPVERS